jgi:hypothetical protein
VREPAPHLECFCGIDLDVIGTFQAEEVTEVDGVIGNRCVDSTVVSDMVESR